jgi:hypothetical protein
VNKPETLEEMLEQIKNTSYTKRLAKSMGDIRVGLLETLLLNGSFDGCKPYEIEVNFDD